jgi:hypothetical protein
MTVLADDADTVARGEALVACRMLKKMACKQSLRRRIVAGSRARLYDQAVRDVFLVRDDAWPANAR